MPISYMCDKCGASLERAEAKRLIWFGGELVGVYCEDCKQKLSRIIAEENGI